MEDTKLIQKIVEKDIMLQTMTDDILHKVLNDEKYQKEHLIQDLMKLRKNMHLEDLVTELVTYISNLQRFIIIDPDLEKIRQLDCYKKVN
jgi:hypothetical protein